MKGEGFPSEKMLLRGNTKFSKRKDRFFTGGGENHNSSSGGKGTKWSTFSKEPDREKKRKKIG